MADFNLEAMSLKELRQLQKDLAKAISTYEDLATAWAFGRQTAPNGRSRNLPPTKSA